MLQKIPSWKLMSKGEREHIKAYHIRENAHLKHLLMLLILKRKVVSCLQEGKDMIVYVMTLSCPGHFLVCSDFLLPYLLPLSHVRFRGRKTSKGRKSLEFFAYLYSWGHVNMQIEYLVLTLYMSTKSWYSCVL